MSNKKHTPEPWVLTEDGRSLVSRGRDERGNTGWEVCTTRGCFNEDARKPLDLARIVACVNACSGIPTEALEAGAVERLVEAAEHAANCLDEIAEIAHGHSEDISRLAYSGHISAALSALKTKEAPDA